MDKPSCACPCAAKRARLDEGDEKSGSESEGSRSENKGWNEIEDWSESESEGSGSENEDGQKTNVAIEEEDNSDDL